MAEVELPGEFEPAGPDPGWDFAALFIGGSGGSTTFSICSGGNGASAGGLTSGSMELISSPGLIEVKEKAVGGRLESLHGLPAR